MKNFDAWSRNLADQLQEKEQTQEIKPEDLYTHKDIMQGEYNKLQEEARTLLEELDKAPLFVFGHTCTSTETVGSISSIPETNYNGTLPEKVFCTKEALGETLSSIWVTTGGQYVITDVVGELVELTKADKNG